MNALATDAELDALRTRADDVIDPLVRSLVAAPGAAGPLLGALFATDDVPTGDDRLRTLFEAIPAVPIQDRARVEEGQRLFQLYGPELLLILGCYALPAAYAAGDGVQVIHRARRLGDDAKRRLCETAQMVLNVMSPGGLEPNGIGTRAANKVRVMHALVRHHVRTQTTPAPWPTTLGEPINQEDLVGTLLTFSVLALDGLRKIGAPLTRDEELGYLEVWRHVGRLLGIDTALVPSDVGEAEKLAVRIGRRQIRPTAEGKELTHQLTRAVNALFPINGYGVSLMHFFLDESAFGVDLAEILDLPAANWTRTLVRARAGHKRFVLRWLNRIPGARARRRALARYFAQQLILLQRPDRQMPFLIPAGYLTAWRLRPPSSAA